VGDTTVQPVALGAPLPRWLALIQAFLVCGIPTQIGIAAVLWLGLDIEPLVNGQITIKFFAILSFLDTALVSMLIYAFLHMSGENSRDVFLGRHAIKSEIWRGLVLVPAFFLAVVTIVIAIRTIVPSLHNVETSPFEAFLGTPTDAAIFLLVVVLAGGIREELQRGFILHRFDQSLGGVRLGLILFSITFGLLHLDQGIDVAVAIGLLGLMWGLLYVMRRSIVAAMTNHACFNAAQVLWAVFARSLGV